MMIQAPSSIRSSLGQGAKLRLFSLMIVGAACLALACGDDDPAAETGVGGSGGVVVDASVRELPGDGLEPTPEFDIDSRQRNPIGPQRLVETLDDARNGNDPGTGAPVDAPDAGDADAPDGGAS